MDSLLPTLTGALRTFSFKLNRTNTWIQLALFFHVLFIYFAVAQSLKFETRIPGTSLSHATGFIISKFYARQASSIFISRSANTSQAYLTQSEVISEVLRKIEFKISYTINNGQGIYNVFFVDSYAGFRYAYIHIQSNLFLFFGQFSSYLSSKALNIF